MSKVLLSAYACEPDRGSEPEVGWRWAVELAGLGYQVWVLTRANNRAAIERGLASRAPVPGLHFVYYDLPGWARWWKKGGRGVRLYYVLWQWGAYRLARRLHAAQGFDRVHHLTFGVARHPSFMGGLGIPFAFGPVGGGERAPWRLRRGYGWRGWMLDGLRDGANALARLDPMMRRTFHQAELILLRTPDSRRLVPKPDRAKIRVQLEIGADMPVISAVTKTTSREGDEFRVLYAGRLIYWKGLHLGLRGFAALARGRAGARLTVVGQGEAEGRLRRDAATLGIADRITWRPWTDRDRLAAAYRAHDVLLFPSLHDSGGSVVLEALAHGLPVICLDLGGPGLIVGRECGRVVATKGRGAAEVADGLGRALIELAEDPALRSTLAAGARRRAREFDWRAQVARVYPPIARSCPTS